MQALTAKQESASFTVLRAFPQGKQLDMEALREVSFVDYRDACEGIIRRNWYALCDPLVPEKALLRDSLNADFLVKPGCLGELDLESLKRGDESYFVLAIMVRGFFRASRAAYMLREKGRLVGFDFVGYSTGLYSVPKRDSNYKTEQVYMPSEKTVELLANDPNINVLLVDDRLASGKTVTAIARELKKNGIINLYYKDRADSSERQFFGAERRKKTGIKFLD